MLLIITVVMGLGEQENAVAVQLTQERAGAARTPATPGHGSGLQLPPWSM
ncbi:hypothetical protein ACXYMU_09980 [Pontibacter sp. CAU 1760]